MDNKRIASFLASGLKPTQIATIVGCSPSYITQLKDSEEFKILLSEVMSKTDRDKAEDEEAGEEKILATKYLAVEHKLLKQVEDTMPFADFKELTRALEVVGKRQEERAKRKVLARLPQGQEGRPSMIVNLTIPVHAVPEYTINGQGEIVSINQKAMAPLGSKGVKDLFDTLSGKKSIMAVEGDF